MTTQPAQAAAVSEDLARKVIQQSVDGLLVIDAEGVVRFANPAAIALFADKTSELVGFQVGMPAINEPVEIVLPGRESTRYVEMRSTEIVWEGRGANLASLRDITDRKRAEDALLESEVYFRTLADCGQALIWTSGTDKKREYFNQPWLNFTRRRLNQELGDGWVEGVHPEDLDSYLQNFTHSFDRRERFSIAYRLRRFDGEYRWLQDHASPRYNRHGGFLGYIGHCLDFTEQKRAEETVASRTRELSEAHVRLTMLDRAKDDFLKIISHELRTPLHGLLGVGEIVLDELAASPEKDQLLEMFAHSRQRMLALLDDALLLTQLDVSGLRSSASRISLSSVLWRAIERTAEFAESRRVTLQAPSVDLGLVQGGDEFLVKAFHSLLETAVKFSGEGGTVRLTNEVIPGYLRILIESNAGRIPNSAIQNFFEIFSTGEPITQGDNLGLGPALACRILSLYGDTVAIANRDPSGIRLTVSFKL